MLGEDLLIAMGGRVIAAQRTCNLNMQQDTIEVCSPVSGAWREYIPSTIGWDISCDGLIYAPEYADELMEVLTSRQKVRLSYYDPELRIVRSGYAIPTGLQQGASINSLATYSLTFQGSGELGKVEADIITPVWRIYSVSNVDFVRDKNHNLTEYLAAEMEFGVFKITRSSRVTIKADFHGSKSVMSIIRFDEGNEDYITDFVVEACDNLRFFQYEIAHLGSSDIGLEQEVCLLLKPGQYAILEEGHDQVVIDLKAISLPTE